MTTEDATPEQEFPKADAETPTATEGAAEDTPKLPEKPELPKDPGKGLPDPSKMPRAQFVIDVLERAAATYLETLVGLLVVADKLSIEYVTAAAMAALPAGLSVVKAGLSRFLGDKTAAAVPRRLHNWAARRAGAEVLPPRRVKSAA